MSTEDQFWKFLQPRLMPYGRAIRVENPVYPGTPDVYYRFRLGQGERFPGWLELKHLDEPPKRKTTSIVIPTLTIQQVCWLREEAESMGRAHLLLRMGGQFYLFGYRAVGLIYDRAITLEMVDEYAACITNKIAEIVKCLANG